MSIDLHCHTLFSVDSYGTPEALVDAAAAQGVTALAITEHNHLGSAERGAARAKSCGMPFFPGIELDVYYGDRSYHFLGLGLDTRTPALQAVAENNHAVYAFKGEVYLQTLLAQGFPWKWDDVEACLPLRYPSHPAPVLTQRVVSFFVERQGGLDGFAEMHEVAVNRVAEEFSRVQDIDFCGFTAARDAVHEAGGVFLLAHVGKYFPGDVDRQVECIRELMQEGIDGFELYHWANFRHPGGERLIEFAESEACLISGGSDCGHAKNPAETHVGRARRGEPTAPDEAAKHLAAACRVSFF